MLAVAFILREAPSLPPELLEPQQLPGGKRGPVHTLQSGTRKAEYFQLALNALLSSSMIHLECFFCGAFNN